MGRRAIVLLVALILAGLAAWAVWNFMQNVRSDVEADQTKVTVFRAGPNGIAEGTEGNILVSDFNAGGGLIEAGEDEFEDTPDDAIQTEDELRSVLSGTVAAGPISAKGILTRSQWTTVSVDVRVHLLARSVPVIRRSRSAPVTCRGSMASSRPVIGST